MPNASPRPLPGRAWMVLVLGLVAVFWSQYGWVSRTNFAGYDEWLCLTLASRGIVDAPYSNRPFGFLWHAPAVWLSPHGFAGFHWLHGAYLALTGLATFWLLRRLAPEDPLLGFLAAVFAAVWMPSDVGRLATVQMLVNSGSTLAVFLALALYLESWKRRSFTLLVLSAATVFVALRSYETGLPLALLAPLLLAFCHGGDRRRRAVWILAWELTGIVVLALLFHLVGSADSRVAYQGQIGLDPAPHRVAWRLLEQYRLHLLPLAGGALRQAAGPAAWSAGCFAFAFLGWIAAVGPVPRPSSRRLAEITALGFVLALAAYVPFSLGMWLQGAYRTEFLAAPGIGLMLAGLLRLLGGKRRVLSHCVMAAAGCWVAAVGTAQTLLLQRAARDLVYYESQVAVLRQITTLAPRFVPGTLVVLQQEGPSWAFRSNFSFRFALEYLYRGEVAGLALGTYAPFFPARFGADGVDADVAPELRGPWRMEPTRHRYSEVVVLRVDVDGIVEVAEAWPRGLPAPPEGRSYAPRGRIRAGPPLPDWAALERP